MSKTGGGDNGAKVQFVVERADWAIRRVGENIRDRINKDYPETIDTTVNPLTISNRLLHFGSQYMWVSYERYLSSSNIYVVSFFHGKREDGDDTSKHIDKFLALSHKLSRIIVSNSILEQRLLSWGLPADQITRIPIGVDTNTFYIPTLTQTLTVRKQFGIPAHAKVIGSFQKDGVGWGDGIEPKLIKGPDTFLAVIAKLKSLGLPIFVFLTGPSRGYIKKGLITLGVPYVHYYPKQHSELVRCYHALDLYLITSREEGGPMSLSESMSTGVPVVSTEVGMAVDLINPGLNGALASVDDIERLTEQAAKIIEGNFPAMSRLNIRDTVLPLDWACIAREHWQRVYSPLLKI